MDVSYLDFAKAFDKVPHQRLLIKMQNHGISGSLLRWVASWLEGRQQRVWVSEGMSGWKRVTSGLPQGSVLGPILFLIYINDIDDGIRSSILKFADDTKIFSSCGEDKHLQMQQDLEKLMNWSRTWQIEFNTEKCKTLHLGRGKSAPFSMDGHMLEAVSEERDLGMTITRDLKASANC